MPLAKKKKFKSGKIKRHKFRKKLGITPGFGKPWSAPSVTFRVEFNWVDPDGDESNERARGAHRQRESVVGTPTAFHWIECRKFKGEEKSFLRSHYAQAKEDWTDRETLESKFVCVYCAGFLVANKDKLHLNQAFIFPTPKKGNETIRDPIYQIRWTEELARNSVFGDSIAIVFNNAIWHKW